MKVKIDLTNLTLSYLDQTPFIQGTDTVRNKIEVYHLPNSFIDMTISYTYASGRSTIALNNDGSDSTTIDGVTYQITRFDLPLFATSEPSQLMATLIIKLSNNDSDTVKLNFTNTVIESSNFEEVESALSSTAQQVLADLSAKSSAISALQSTTTTQGRAIADQEERLVRVEVSKAYLDAAYAEVDQANQNQAALDLRLETLETGATSLQSQIDGINAGQNLADIVADIAALNNYDTSNLMVGDKIQVLVDYNYDNGSTVYNWNGTIFTYIGKYGQDSYTKEESETKFAPKRLNLLSNVNTTVSNTRLNVYANVDDTTAVKVSADALRKRMFRTLDVNENAYDLQEGQYVFQKI